MDYSQGFERAPFVTFQEISERNSEHIDAAYCINKRA